MKSLPETSYFSNSPQFKLLESKLPDSYELLLIAYKNKKDEYAITFDLAMLYENETREETFYYFQNLDGVDFDDDDIICWSYLPKELQEFQNAEIQDYDYNKLDRILDKYSKEYIAKLPKRIQNQELYYYPRSSSRNN